MSAFYVFVAFCFLSGVSAASRFQNIDTDNHCPTVTTPSNFNVSRFLGIWYYTYTTIDYMGDKCSIMYHTKKENATTENLYSAEYSKEGLSMVRLAQVQQLDPSQPAKFHLKAINNYWPVTLDRSILGTDYENYAVIYECYIVGGERVIDASILTRKRISAVERVDEASRVAARNGLKYYDFHYISATACRLD